MSLNEPNHNDLIMDYTNLLLGIGIKGGYLVLSSGFLVSLLVRLTHLHTEYLLQVRNLPTAIVLAKRTDLSR